MPAVVHRRLPGLVEAGLGAVAPLPARLPALRRVDIVDQRLVRPVPLVHLRAAGVVVGGDLVAAGLGRALRGPGLRLLAVLVLEVVADVLHALVLLKEVIALDDAGRLHEPALHVHVGHRQRDGLRGVGARLVGVHVGEEVLRARADGALREQRRRQAHAHRQAVVRGLARGHAEQFVHQRRQLAGALEVPARLQLRHRLAVGRHLAGQVDVQRQRRVFGEGLAARFAHGHGHVVVEQPAEHQPPEIALREQRPARTHVVAGVLRGVPGLRVAVEVAHAGFPHLPPLLLVVPVARVVELHGSEVLHARQPVLVEVLLVGHVLGLPGERVAQVGHLSDALVGGVTGEVHHFARHFLGGVPDRATAGVAQVVAGPEHLLDRFNAQAGLDQLAAAGERPAHLGHARHLGQHLAGHGARGDVRQWLAGAVGQHAQFAQAGAQGLGQGLGRSVVEPGAALRLRRRQHPRVGQAHHHADRRGRGRRAQAHHAGRLGGDELEGLGPQGQAKLDGVHHGAGAVPGIVVNVRPRLWGQCGEGGDQQAVPGPGRHLDAPRAASGRWQPNGACPPIRSWAGTKQDGPLRGRPVSLDGLGIRPRTAPASSSAPWLRSGGCARR